MKAGDLVRVRNTSTGDVPAVVELYRTGDPCLVLEVAENFKPLSGTHLDGPWVSISAPSLGKELTVRFAKLEVIET